MKLLVVFTMADETTVNSLYAPQMHRKMYTKNLPVKKPPRSKMTIFREPCEDHTGAPTLTLETYGPLQNPETIYDNFLGLRKYCVLCWLPVGDFLKNESGAGEKETKSV